MKSLIFVVLYIYTQRFHCPCSSPLVTCGTASAACVLRVHEATIDLRVDEDEKHNVLASPMQSRAPNVTDGPWSGQESVALQGHAL